MNPFLQHIRFFPLTNDCRYLQSVEMATPLVFMPWSYMGMQNKIYGSLVWFVATLFVIYSFCLNTAAAVFANAIRTTLHASNFEVFLVAGAFFLGFACKAG